MHGEGTYNYANGAIYCGHWENNCKSGYGTHTYPNGDVYVGSWADNKKSGYGEYTYASGATFKGAWKGDEKCGSGVYEYAHGDTYDGEFVNSKMHGNGLYFYSDGAFYEGGWENNTKSGYGRYVYANGDEYVGMWANSLKEGQGRYAYASGEVKDGVWKHDLFAGPVDESALGPAALPVRNTRPVYGSPSPLPTTPGREVPTPPAAASAPPSSIFGIPVAPPPRPAVAAARRAAIFSGTDSEAAASACLHDPNLEFGSSPSRVNVSSSTVSKQTNNITEADLKTLVDRQCRLDQSGAGNPLSNAEHFNAGAALSSLKPRTLGQRANNQRLKVKARRTAATASKPPAGSGVTDPFSAVYGHPAPSTPPFMLPRPFANAQPPPPPTTAASTTIASVTTATATCTSKPAPVMPAKPTSPPNSKVAGIAINDTCSPLLSPVGTDDNTCIVCMNAPRNGAILHGGTIHVHCCFACANALRSSKKHCPMCRLKIEQVFRLEGEVS